MITDDEVMRLFERADPARVDDDKPAIDAAGYLATLRTRSSTTVTLINTDPTAAQRPSHHRRLIIAAAAAVAAIIVGGLVLVARNDPTNPHIPVGPPTTAAETSAAEAEDIATGFLDAYVAFDADRAITYLSSDALAEVSGTQEQFRLDLAFFQAQPYTQIIGDCEQQAETAAGISIRCPFDFHAIRSDEIGLGPYRDNYWELTIRDGKIVSAQTSLAFMTNGFSEEMWVPFASWVSAEYPQDAAVMYTDGTHTEARTSEESMQLWDQRSQEYVDHVTSSREEYTSQVGAICTALSQRLAGPASPNHDDRAIDHAAIVAEAAAELRTLPRPPSTDLTEYTNFYSDLDRLATLIVDGVEEGENPLIDPQGEYLELRRQLDTAEPLLQPCVAALPI